MTHIIGETCHEAFVLFTSGQPSVDGLTGNTQRLDYLFLAFEILPLSVHYTLPHNRYPTLLAA